MGRGNLYLSDLEVQLVLAAIDVMLDGLPVESVVPDVDRADARRDRASYELLKSKLERHVS